MRLSLGDTTLGQEARRSWEGCSETEPDIRKLLPGIPSVATKPLNLGLISESLTKGLLSLTKWSHPLPCLAGRAHLGGTQRA